MATLPSCECIGSFPPVIKLDKIYCALLQVIADSVGGSITFPLSPAQGGTGVANAAGETITINGGFSLGLTLTGATNVTLPTSGTIQVFNQGLNTFDDVNFDGLTTGSLSVNASADFNSNVTFHNQIAGSDNSNSLAGEVFTADGAGGGVWATPPISAIDTGWTANSTAGDKTAVLVAYSNGLTGTMVTALNTVSAGTGTSLSTGLDTVALLVKKVAALETALVAAKRPNA